MRIGKEVADAGIAEQFIHARYVTALRQPNTLWPFAEMALEFVGAKLDLGSDGIAVDGHQRQEAMRRGTGDQLQLASFIKAPEAVEQIIAVLVDKDIPRPLEPFLVHARQ